MTQCRSSGLLVDINLAGRLGGLGVHDYKDGCLPPCWSSLLAVLEQSTLHWLSSDILKLLPTAIILSSKHNMSYRDNDVSPPFAQSYNNSAKSRG